ncbi:MAG: tetraacyldisaccharide 4'-kinase [Pseudomonadota bacterium]
MKAPRFWQSKNIISTLLLPFSWIYLCASRICYNCITPVTLPIPVICVGNLTVGGAGKTPVALHIGELLKKKNIKAFFVSRGYGGNQKSAVRVNAELHSALQVGDEPLLLAQILPTIVGKNRVEAANLAIAQGAEIIVMDDGFQNPTLTKNLSLIVVDRRLSFGNERLLPAGPLREKVANGLKRAGAIVIINPANFMPTSLPNIPFLLARSQPRPSMLALNGKKIIAFCGIAIPHKFYYMLKNAGAEIVEKISFADHYYYKAKDLQLLHQKAKEHGAALVTTSKDFARMGKEFKDEIRDIQIAEMGLVFENQDKLESLIEEAINAKKS